MSDTYRVVAVNIATQERRIMDTGKSQQNADAIVNMAIARRGLDTEFYIVEPETAP